MKKLKIQSDPDPETSWPWFALEVADGSPDFEITEANGLIPFRHRMRSQAMPFGPATQALVEANAAKLKGKRKGVLKRGAPPPGALRQPGRQNYEDEIHVVAVTIDGEVDFVPHSEQRLEYYAHLAWYDPKTQTWDVLDFAPMPVAAE